MEIGTCTPDPTDNDTAEDFGKYIVNGYTYRFDSIGTDKARTMLTNSLANQGDGYWLSCVSIITDNYYAHFGPGSIKIVVNGKKSISTCEYLFASGSNTSPGNASEASRAFHFRAIVYLDSNVPAT